MKISHNWLTEYIQTELEPSNIAHILTSIGLEVEGIQQVESIPGGLKGVVVAEVISCEQHPNADKLKVTQVHTGTDTFQVVCGAPNVAKGQKVLLATVGTTLYPSADIPMKIKVSRIREIESHGMLCAEDELGLGSSHEGILVLDGNIPAGTLASELFEAETDTVYEIGLTPNRADAMGHIGVARELAAYLTFHEKVSTKVNWPDIGSFRVDEETMPIEIEVRNKEFCPRYCGISIQGVEIAESPGWLKNRLQAIGIKPIHNVVDVTNYVMMELGTPLHAFDADKTGNKIIVDIAAEGETFVTLDGVERKLSPRNLMISGNTDHLCLAGVFGGNSSGISENTRNVFLESAYFQPQCVRKTAREHGLHTDASFRFERGVDPTLTLFALKRAALLIKEIAGGNIAMQPQDIKLTETEHFLVDFSFERCRKLIGCDIPNEQILSILQSLDIQAVSVEKDSAIATVPPYRVDVKREVDIIEEVLRIYGYNQVPLPEKLNTVLPSKTSVDKHQQISETITEFLVGKGFMEIMNNSLVSANLVETFDPENAHEQVRLLNPLSNELDAMRQTLLFGVLEGIAYNQNRQHPDIRFFEFGGVYRKRNQTYQEQKKLVIAVSGRQAPESWLTTDNKHSYYSLKSTVTTLMDRLGMRQFYQESSLKHAFYEDGVSLQLLKEHLGEMGWIRQEMLEHFGIKNPVFIAELNWGAVMAAQTYVKVQYNEIPKTFAVRRDFSLLLNANVPFKDIVQLARSCDKKLLKDINLFDVYEGKNLPAGKKSYAVSFLFQDKDQTLKDSVVDDSMNRIRTKLESELSAQLR